MEEIYTVNWSIWEYELIYLAKPYMYNVSNIVLLRSCYNNYYVFILGANFIFQLPVVLLVVLKVCKDFMCQIAMLRIVLAVLYDLTHIIIIRINYV